MSASIPTWVCGAGIIVTLFSSAAVVLGVPSRFLVWSAVGHCGLILTGVGLARSAAAPAGVEAALLYVVNLAIAQLLAWASWRLMRGSSKSPDFGPARGMGRRMPGVASAFTIGAAALAGLPPCAGFFARVMLFAAGFKAGGALGFGAVIACSIQSLAWLAVALYAASAVWLGAPPTRPVRPVSRSRLVGFALLAALTAVLGLIPGPAVQAGERLAYLLGARS